MDKNKVVIGMSGGVDSSVAAYILKQKGYDVIGVTMKLWQDDDPDVMEKEGGCCSLSSIDDARMVADKLGIPFYVMNFKEIFKDKVIANFLDEYGRGRTPNPCIVCNKDIKFEELMRRAFGLDAYYVATGHYAIIEEDEETGKFYLKKSKAAGKDQTYALYNMTQEQLRHTLMPLGEFESKDEVREIARELGLVVSNKPDSQEICFVPDDDYSSFIRKNAGYKVRGGSFVDRDGNILGRHKGITDYTIGQRKGLGLALGKPAYVVDIDAEKNQVVIGDNEDIFRDELTASDVNLIYIDELSEPIRVTAKIRYSAKEVDATVYPIEGEDRVKVVFEEHVRAVTPGQSIVFYDGDLVVGGGIIE